MKIISVVGKKNTGKTSLSVKIIEELTKRGYDVASIKHSHHAMEMDRPNTDTWKHKQAGSQIVVGIGSTTFFNIRKHLDLERLLFLIKVMGNTDFVVIEGFKTYNYPKISTSPDVVDEYTIKQVNSFTITPDEISDLCDLIELRGHDIINTLFLNNCGYSDGESIAHEIRSGNIKNDELDRIVSYMSIDGNVIGLNRFVSDYIRRTIIGIINTLHIEEYGVNDLNKIELIINNDKKLKFKNNECAIYINDEMIAINEFVENIISNTLYGVVKSLDVGKIASIEINIDDDVELEVNGKLVLINKFVKNILKETTLSIINSLKIDDEINKIRITCHKE